MTVSILIQPKAEHLSPYQATRPKAPEIVNDDFLSSFSDLVDIVNPLHHIPGVSAIYREISGDTISAGARIAGGALLGGPIGLLTSVINAMVAEETGRDIGQNLFALVTDSYDKTSKLV